MANRQAAPEVLEMFQVAQKLFEITVLDDDGDPVNLSSMTLRFIVQDSNAPAVAIFKVQGSAIVVSGTNNEIAGVTVSPTESATASREYHWRLWNITDEGEEQVLKHGPFKIVPALKDMA